MFFECFASLDWVDITLVMVYFRAVLLLNLEYLYSVCVQIGPACVRWLNNQIYTWMDLYSVYISIYTAVIACVEQRLKNIDQCWQQPQEIKYIV